MLARFEPAGSITGPDGPIMLVRHRCLRFAVGETGTEYISATPSPPGDAYVVPMCGCRPEPADG